MVTEMNNEQPTVPADLDYRKELAVTLLSEGRTDLDLELNPNLAMLSPAATLTADLAIDFPAGLDPVPQPLANAPDPNDPIGRADVLVITWTVDEQNALCDVLTPSVSRNAWYRYRHNFEAQEFRGRIRPGAPSLQANRLGSYFRTKIGAKQVVCFKSELHLNQDGIETSPGMATLPVKDLFKQLIDEIRPTHVFTVGTAGATFANHRLGNVVVTRAAKFRLQQEFRSQPYRSSSYKSDWQIPRTHMDRATQLMQGFADRLKEPPTIAPTVGYQVSQTPDNAPKAWFDGDEMPPFHPILTTDFFEFGTSGNRLETQGCGVEMGDAALGLAAEELGAAAPKWAVVRNLSDPQINAQLPDGPGREQNLQAAWAVYYYRTYGYWTSVNSALTTWAIIAGL